MKKDSTVLSHKRINRESTRKVQCSNIPEKRGLLPLFSGGARPDTKLYPDLPSRSYFMIFPQEYKNVGISRADKTKHADRNTVYFLSEYLLEENGSGWSLYRISHTGEGPLRRVSGAELLAGPEEVVFYSTELNIKNRALLIEKAAEICSSSGGSVNTVIFTGHDRHMTFVHRPDLSVITEIEIIDILPPAPAKLPVCIRRLEDAGVFDDLCVRFSEKIVDLSQYGGPKTIFPCSVSGLSGRFLDSDVITENDCLLVGCHMSRKIFEARFPDLSYRFVDLCPMHSDLTKPDRPFIMRCCQSENAGKIFTINGQTGTVVHWGASAYDICEAVRKLAGVLKNGKTFPEK